jgi:hypothetical protein
LWNSWKKLYLLTFYWNPCAGHKSQACTNNLETFCTPQSPCLCSCLRLGFKNAAYPAQRAQAPSSPWAATPFCLANKVWFDSIEVSALLTSPFLTFWWQNPGGVSHMDLNPWWVSPSFRLFSPSPPASLSLSVSLLCLCDPGWELLGSSSLLWPNSNWTILLSLPESQKGGWILPQGLYWFGE